MARAGRKDRGLLAKKDSTGKTVWHVRLYHEGERAAVRKLFDQDGGAILLRAV